MYKYVSVTLRFVVFFKRKFFSKRCLILKLTPNLTTYCGFKLLIHLESQKHPIQRSTNVRGNITESAGRISHELILNKIITFYIK